MSSIARTITVDTPSEEEITVYRGSFLQIDFTLQDSDGSAISIADGTVKFTVYDIQAGANEFQLRTQPVTSGSWAADVVTFTSAAHGFAVDDVVIVEDCTPSNYNGTYTIVSVPTASTFTAALVGDPGAFTDAGYVTDSTARIEMTTPASGLFTVYLEDTQTDTDAKTYRYSVWVKLSGGSELVAADSVFRIYASAYAGN